MAMASAAAQEAPSNVARAIDEGDIIVTARRRAETAQEAPVAISVLSSAMLDRYAAGDAAKGRVSPVKKLARQYRHEVRRE
jgi:iron complex outermembrane receptor protein